MTYLRSLPFLTALLTAVSAAGPPSTGQDWISVGKGQEFQPAKASNEHLQRALSEAQARFLEETSSEQQQQQQQTSFVDSTETYYDGYAQAWRYVGFYTDCNPNNDNDGRRRLEEEVVPCTRYLLWAAYVDLDYQGGGIGEYQFFDTYAEEWDTSACETTGTGINEEEDGTITIDETKCKKMDCHLPNTNWQLMGYFKHQYYYNWFEQLFKHEGYCVWQENEYNFMYNNYAAWPEGCTQSDDYLSDGSALYYDLKVLPNATMGYGLYTDARCSVDYTGDEVTVQSVIGNEDNDGDGEGDFLSNENLEYWNEAMEIYRVCQPCRAYALNDYGGNDERQRKHRRKLDDNNDPNNGLFQCDDVAGYTNVNQCMKFRTQTQMEFATLEEVLDAAQQGGITAVYSDGKKFGQYKAGIDMEALTPDWMLLWIACGVFGGGIIIMGAALLWTRTRCRSVRRKSLRKPLIQEDDDF